MGGYDGDDYTAVRNAVTSFAPAYPLPLLIFAASGDILSAAMSAMPSTGPGTRNTVVHAHEVAFCEERTKIGQPAPKSSSKSCT